MPVRNEAGFIAQNLEQLFAQDYPPERLEFLIADGMSDDGTRDIVAGYVAKDPRVQLIDNPGRIVSTGLNRAIAAAKGDVVLRIDGHCEVAHDFVSQNIQLQAEHPEAWVTGGPIHHEGKNAFGKAVAIAMSHPCGVGLATHRFPGYEGYVEGAQFPAFRKIVFEKAGTFDENLVRNQDDELNFRINQAGGKIFISPRVKYVYFVRGKLSQLWRQYFQYSYWRIPVMRKHKRPTTPRQVVPALFFLAVLVLLGLGLYLHLPWLAFGLPAVYVTVLLLAGIAAMPKAGFLVGLLLPIALGCMHLAYACGMYYGLWSLLFRHNAWNTGGSMTKLSR
jgi:glycosyltransferase involved in cell wall biosynthesis